VKYWIIYERDHARRHYGISSYANHFYNLLSTMGAFLKDGPFQIIKSAWASLPAPFNEAKQLRTKRKVIQKYNPFLYAFGYTLEPPKEYLCNQES